MRSHTLALWFIDELLHFIAAELMDICELPNNTSCIASQSEFVEGKRK